MKKAAFAVGTAFVLLVAMAVAQTDNSQTPGSSGSQGAQSSSPSTPGSQSSSGSMGQGSADNSMKGSTQGEKTLKGCIENENGSYLLETMHGKEIALTGTDVSAHAGHEVKVHGSWEGGSSTSSETSSSSMGASAKSGKTFNVTSVDMVSDTCKMSSKHSKGSMSGSGNTTSPPQK